MNVQPFNPGRAGLSVAIDVSAASQAALIFSTKGYRQVRVCNDGTATVWIEFGAANVAAAVDTGIAVPAGAVEVLTVPAVDGGTYAAAIAAGATGKVHFRPGSGI
jgi:hypothetical protein